jgi:hypothetical protein
MTCVSFADHHILIECALFNIADYEDWTGFQVSPCNLIKSEAKPRTGSKCEDLKSSPVRMGEFEMTSHTSKYLLLYIYVIYIIHIAQTFGMTEIIVQTPKKFTKCKKGQHVL